MGEVAKNIQKELENRIKEAEKMAKEIGEFIAKLASKLLDVANIEKANREVQKTLDIISKSTVKFTESTINEMLNEYDNIVDNIKKQIDTSVTNVLRISNEIYLLLKELKKLIDTFLIGKFKREADKFYKTIDNARKSIVDKVNKIKKDADKRLNIIREGIISSIRKRIDLFISKAQDVINKGQDTVKGLFSEAEKKLINANTLINNEKKKKEKQREGFFAGTLQIVEGFRTIKYVNKNATKAIEKKKKAPSKAQV